MPSFLKESCPCGNDNCSATGAPIKSTGHSKHCWDGCEVCNKPKAKSHRHTLPSGVRRSLMVRCQGMCEARIPDVCSGVYEHAHHKRRRSQGGGDYLSNLQACCSECHSWIHANPEKAIELGLLIPASVVPDPPSSAVVKVEKVVR